MFFVLILAWNECFVRKWYVCIENENCVNILSRWFTGYIYNMHLVLLLDEEDWKVILPL